MTKIKGYVVIAFLIVCVLYIISIHTIKNQYDEELTKLRKDNKVQKHEINRLKKDNEEKNLAIESLLDGIQCDCGWYEDFYYDHMDEVGAYE